MADINKDINIKVNWHDQQAKTGAQKLKTGVKGIGKATDEVNQKSKSFFSNMSTSMKLVTGYLTTRLISGFINLGKKLVTSAGKFEQLNIAFETFLGSKKKATALINELDRFAARTPFLTSQVNAAAKGLLAFGFEADEIIPTMKMLGDISAGTGKDLKELGIIFGQIKGAGRLMGQDLLQLISAGFNPLQVISEKTGRSMRDLKDDMSKGAISFEMVTQAFKDATSEGGRFYNLTEKQSKSLLGRISTLQSNFELLARSIGEVLVPAVAKVVDFLIPFVAAITKLPAKMKSFIAVVGLAIPAFIALRIALLALQLSMGPIGWIMAGISVAAIAVAAAFRTQNKEVDNAAKSFSGLRSELLDRANIIDRTIKLLKKQNELTKEERNELGKNLSILNISNQVLKKRGGLNSVINRLLAQKRTLLKQNTELGKENKKTISGTNEVEKDSIEIKKEVAKSQKEIQTAMEAALKAQADKDKKDKKSADDEAKRLEQKKKNWESAISGISNALGRLSPQAKNVFDDIADVVEKAFSGDIAGTVIAVADFIINTIIDIFEATKRREEQAAAFTIELMEKLGLTRAEMAVKALEEEKDLVLQRFELTADNYENMNEVTKTYYDLLMAKEKEKYDLMTADEKKEFDIKKKFTDEKLKVEKAYQESIKKAQVEVAKVQLKIALARVEADRAEALSRIKKEYWAPWDKDKLDKAWSETQGLYNNIKADLSASLSGLGLQKGGIVKGFGGGDKVSARLEPGEAVLPKEWQINPIPFFNSLLAMRGATQGVSNNINNMNSSKQVSFAGANFIFQGSNAKEVIQELELIAENTNTRVFNTI